jgi:hypothetical protein
MEIKGCTELISKQNDRVYVMHVPQGANYVELYGAALEIINFASEKLAEISKNATQAAPKDVPVDEAQDN